MKCEALCWHYHVHSYVLSFQDSSFPCLALNLLGHPSVPKHICLRVGSTYASGQIKVFFVNFGGSGRVKSSRNLFFVCFKIYLLIVITWYNWKTALETKGFATVHHLRHWHRYRYPLWRLRNLMAYIFVLKHAIAYTVNHKSGSTFVIITLENIDRFL